MQKTKSLLYRILDASAADLSLKSVDKFVLVTLAKHLNPQRNGALVWPSQARIVELTGASESSVRRSLARLEALAYIKRQRSERRNNIYAVQSDVILAVIDTGHTDRLDADTGHTDRSIPVTLTGNTGHTDRLMVNRTAKGNTEGTIVSRSPGRKECKDEHQRSMALLGIVSQVADAMSTNNAERPKIEKPKKRAANG